MTFLSSVQTSLASNLQSALALDGVASLVAGAAAGRALATYAPPPSMAIGISRVESNVGRWRFIVPGLSAFPTTADDSKFTAAARAFGTFGMEVCKLGLYSLLCDQVEEPLLTYFYIRAHLFMAGTLGSLRASLHPRPIDEIRHLLQRL